MKGRFKPGSKWIHRSDSFSRTNSQHMYEASQLSTHLIFKIKNYYAKTPSIPCRSKRHSTFSVTCKLAWMTHTSFPNLTPPKKPVVKPFFRGKFLKKRLHTTLFCWTPNATFFDARFSSDEQ